ncbi:thymus-specific serine protease-like isoform X2 [Acropora palmata]|uniref:thymus-specific serine protease-like isoform X2 n=1 Tax=Acropora palmata TaxID=6131 RepID=UPI003DA0D51D
MSRFSSPLVLLLVFVLRVSCLRTEIFSKFRELVHKEQYMRWGRGDFIEEGTIKQPLDHFHPPTQKSITFEQRYWVNSNYWNNSTGPVFLYIGGEFEMSGAYIDFGHVVEMAEQYRGLIFGVEHRFYGLSTFEECMDNYNITFLTSQQALADLAQFVAFARKFYNMTDANKWIAYGGSYPGSLSAWFRLKYPKLVVGAVASSAPVEAKTDFQGYHNVVASSFASTLVGGSAKCRDNLKLAFYKLDEMIQREDFATLALDFIFCQNISSKNDVWLFTKKLANIFDGIVQNNDENIEYSIAKVCRYMTYTDDTPYAKLVQFVQNYLKHMGMTCLNNSYTSFVTSLNNTRLDPLGEASSRQWFYQTCSQFGYFQTCEANTSCVYSTLLADLPHYLDICLDVFGIPGKGVYQGVAFTNSDYGGKTPNGSKIVFVNGSIDPWHALSVLSNLTTSEVAIFIPGTSHYANMYADSPEDPPALSAARKEVSRLVGVWLQTY